MDKTTENLRVGLRVQALKSNDVPSMLVFQHQILQLLDLIDELEDTNQKLVKRLRKVKKYKWKKPK